MSKRGAIDCSAKDRGVWLIKVPKYLSEQWMSHAGKGEVGRLKVTPSGTPILYSSEAVTSSLRADMNVPASTASSPSTNSVRQKLQANLAAGAVPIGKKSNKETAPTQHDFVIMDIKDQTMAVLSEDKTVIDPDEVTQRSGKLRLEGRIVKRAECRPPKDEKYMRMKISSIEKDCKPTRAVKMLNETIIKFKPIAHHVDQITKEKQKKEGKNARLDRDVVLDLIFQAFEKHQYYKLVDLARVTKQPPGYLKEILSEFATYNTSQPHKHLWELKPEYRHYKEGQAESSQKA